MTTYRKRMWARTDCGIFSLPPICRHEARLMASSMAWVAPLPDAGRKECAASPICTMREPGEVQLGWGSRQRSSKLMTVLGGVHLTRRL